MDPETMGNVCRSLSKSGSLNGFTDHTQALRKFSESGTEAEIVKFYEYLRDESDRSEDEWRAEFESIFPQVIKKLPAIPEECFWGKQLHALVEEGDLKKVKSFIERIGILNWPLDEDWDDFELFPIEDEDEQCERPIQKATRLGHNEIATYLSDVLRRFKPKS